jgi:hypothetical protein
MFTKKLLGVVVSSCFAEAGSEQSTATQEQTPVNVPGSDQTAVQPAAATIPANQTAQAVTPVNSEERHGAELGERRANLIFGAEQAIEQAKASAFQTRLDGLIEMLDLHSEKARIRYYSQCEVAMKAMSPEGKLNSTNKNYIPELRRLSAAMSIYLAGPEEAGKAEMENLRKMLTGPGTYAEKVQKLPRASAAGGSNRGTGVASVSAAIKDAAAQGVTVTPAEVAAVVEARKKGIDVSKALTQPPTTQPPVKNESNQPTEVRAQPLAQPAEGNKPVQSQGTSSTEKNRTELNHTVRDAIRSTPEEQLESLVAHVANRLKASNVKKWQDTGAVMIDMIHPEDADEQTEEAAQPATGTNG